MGTVARVEIGESMQGAKALELLSAELAAVREDRLVHINVNVLHVVCTLFAAVSRLEPVRAALLALPGAERDLVARVQLLAEALLAANYDRLRAPQRDEELRALAAPAKELRERLLADVQPLLVRGLLDARKLRSVRRSTSYLALATDVRLLASVLRECAPHVQQWTEAREQDLAQADALGKALHQLVGVKQQATTPFAAASDVRARVFTLAVEAYEELQSAVHAVRWKQRDAERYVPSLYALRAKLARKRTPKPAVDAPVVTEAPAQPARIPPEFSALEETPIEVIEPAPSRVALTARATRSAPTLRFDRRRHQAASRHALAAAPRSRAGASSVSLAEPMQAWPSGAALLE